MAYLNGFDIENALEAQIPHDAEYVWLGTTPDGSARIVFSSAKAAFDWGMKNIGATVIALKVGHLHRATR